MILDLVWQGHPFKALSHGGMDLIGRTIGTAVHSSYRPPASIRTVGRRSLPTVGLYGLLSSRIFRSWNLPKFMAEKNRELGPVFQIRAPSRRLVVFANAEMNRWVGHKGRLFRQLGDREDHIRRDGLPATKTSTRTHSGTLCPD